MVLPLKSMARGPPRQSPSTEEGPSVLAITSRLCSPSSTQCATSPQTCCPASPDALQQRLHELVLLRPGKLVGTFADVLAQSSNRWEDWDRIASLFGAYVVPDVDVHTLNDLLTSQLKSKAPVCGILSPSCTG